MWFGEEIKVGMFTGKKAMQCDKMLIFETCMLMKLAMNNNK